MCKLRPSRTIRSAHADTGEPTTGVGRLRHVDAPTEDPRARAGLPPPSNRTRRPRIGCSTVESDWRPGCLSRNECPDRCGQADGLDGPGRLRSVRAPWPGRCQLSIVSSSQPGWL